MPTVYDGYYLLDRHVHRNDPAERPWYTTRRTCHHGHTRPHLIVIHTPETLEDFVAPYDEAERIAKYGATITRASWHDTIDADSIIPMLPGGYTAWHVRGFNRCGIGLEIGAKAASWDRAPQAWVEGVLDNAALRCAFYVARYAIPVRLLITPGKRYTTGIDPSGFGFVSHHALDPSRRTDPGFSFPWADFLTRVSRQVKGEEPDMKPPAWAVSATQWHIDNGIYTETRPEDVDEDEAFHRQTVFRHRFYQRVVAPALRTAAGSGTVPPHKHSGTVEVS